MGLGCPQRICQSQKTRGSRGYQNTAPAKLKGWLLLESARLAHARTTVRVPTRAVRRERFSKRTKLPPLISFSLFLNSIGTLEKEPVGRASLFQSHFQLMVFSCAPRFSKSVAHAVQAHESHKKPYMKGVTLKEGKQRY